MRMFCKRVSHSIESPVGGIPTKVVLYHDETNGVQEAVDQTWSDLKKKKLTNEQIGAVLKALEQAQAFESVHG